MDKNQITGIVLIFVILFGFWFINKPSQEEIEIAKHRQDSIRIAQNAKDLEASRIQMEENSVLKQDDSTLHQEVANRYGTFGNSAIGTEEFYVIENNLMKVTLSNKGGKVYSVELKGYLTYDKKPLILFDGDNNNFGISFASSQARNINTEDLYFTPSIEQKLITVKGGEVKKGSEGNVEYNEENPGGKESLTMTLDIGDGATLKYVYTLEHNSYMLGFDLQTKNMGSVISNADYLNFLWSFDSPRLERMSKFGEDRYATIYYRFFEDEVESLATAETSSENLMTKVQWVSFKQLFFNSTIIANEAFSSAMVQFEYEEGNPLKLGHFTADLTIPYNENRDTDFGMNIYFGPNHYNTLKQYDGTQMDELINLGWSILRWVNQYLVIPTFNILRNHIDSFGIIILLLTIVIKLILFPFTYKSYVSQAKMRALKPEVDALTEKYGTDPEKAMEKQKATMALYKKAGVNPMGGCLPMLLQMPVLFALFYFFPTSIELRQESFWWAEDLSSYDSIFNLPFEIPFYGSHVSLFCLLMTITTIISTKLNSQTQSSNAMPGMKTMMYMMPVMFLFILNNYPSGLSYYYFLANLITIGQMFLVRRIIDEDKIRAKIMVNKKKTVKKSKFQQKLEKMAKEKGVDLPK